MSTDNNRWSWRGVLRPTHTRPPTPSEVPSVHRSRPQYSRPLVPAAYSHVSTDNGTDSSSSSSKPMRFQKSWTPDWYRSPFSGLWPASKLATDTGQGRNTAREGRGRCDSRSLGFACLLLVAMLLLAVVIGFTVYAVTKSGENSASKDLSMDVTYDIDRKYQDAYSDQSSTEFAALQTELCSGVVSAMDANVVRACQLLAARESQLNEESRTMVTFRLTFDKAALSAALAKRGISEMTSELSRDAILMYGLMSVLEAEEDNVLHGSDVCQDASCHDKVEIAPSPSSTQQPTDLETSSSQATPTVFPNETFTMNITFRFPDIQFIPEYYDVTSKEFKEMEALLCNEFKLQLGGVIKECAIISSRPGSTISLFSWVLNLAAEMAAEIAGSFGQPGFDFAAILDKYTTRLDNVLSNLESCDASFECSVPSSILYT